MLTNEEVDRIAEAVIKKLAISDNKLQCSFCESAGGIEQHAKSHEALDKFIKNMERIDNIKWGVAQFIAIMIVGGVAAIIWGMIKND